MTKQAPTMPKAFARKVQALKPQRKREAFRRRQLAKIDAQLAEFGIEPLAQKAEKPEPSYFMMILDGDERENRCAA